MKKLFILSFASILMLTGCGATETLSCTYKTDATNGSTKVSYDIDHEQDEIKKVRITYDYNFNNTNGDNNNTGGSVDNRTRNTTGGNNGMTDDNSTKNTTEDIETNNAAGNNTGSNANGTTGNSNASTSMSSSRTMVLSLVRRSYFFSITWA